MLLSYLMSCSKECIHQKDGFCEIYRDRMITSEITSRSHADHNMSTVLNESDERNFPDKCGYYKKRRQQNASDSRMEFYV